MVGCPRDSDPSEVYLPSSSCRRPDGRCNETNQISEADAVGSEAADIFDFNNKWRICIHNSHNMLQASNNSVPKMVLKYKNIIFCRNLH